MKALSFTRPWPFTILHLGKRLENRARRDGREPKALTRYRGELLIHAAKSWDPGVPTFMGRESIHPIPDCVYRRHEHPTGLVGVCRVIGHVEASPHGPVYTFETGPAGTSWTFPAIDLRWWMGGFALILDDVKAFPEPIPCLGALGTWRVPTELEGRVREQIRRAA